MGDKMLEAEIWTIARMDDGTAALLRPLKSDLAVPIFIGDSEAQAILLGRWEVAVSRPLTHELRRELWGMPGNGGLRLSAKRGRRWGLRLRV
jgi:bifunctional DNase/RNase